MEIRTIIKEALSRANIVPRRQAAPGDLVESAEKLLHGIVSKYNNDNYLVFSQEQLSLPSRKVIHIYDEDDTMLGENNRVFPTEALLLATPPTEEDVLNDVYAIAKDRTTVYYRAIKVGLTPEWFCEEHPDEFDQRYQQMLRYVDAYHIHVQNVSKLNTLCINRGQVYGMYKLGFVPRSDFDAYVDGGLFWTYTPLAEGEWVIQVKPYVVSNTQKLRLDYNRGIKFDLDTDLRIPEAYEELLTTALTHALAVKYPRMDDAQIERLKNDVQVMLDNVRTPKADSKMVTRELDYGDDRGTPEGLMRGNWFYA